MRTRQGLRISNEKRENIRIDTIMYEFEYVRLNHHRNVKQENGINAPAERWLLLVKIRVWNKINVLERHVCLCVFAPYTYVDGRHYLWSSGAGLLCVRCEYLIKTKYNYKFNVFYA